MSHRSLSDGFSLIEVLMALFVFTIGILGIAKLQEVSISNSYDAYLATQAMVLMADIIDRMRANRTQALTDAYAINFQSSPPANTPCFPICSAEQISKLDLLEWKCGLGKYFEEEFCEGLVTQATLPNGDGEIEVFDAHQQTKVTIKWLDTQGSERKIETYTGL